MSHTAHALFYWVQSAPRKIFLPGGKLKVVLHNTKGRFWCPRAAFFDNARSIFLQAANFSASVCISSTPPPLLFFVQPFEPLYHIQNGKAQWERKSRPFTGLAARRSGFLLGAGPYGSPVGKADGAITVHIQADHGAGEPLAALQPLAGKVGRLGNRPERLPRATVFHGKAACALPCRNVQPDFFSAAGSGAILDEITSYPAYSSSSNPPGPTPNF